MKYLLVLLMAVYAAHAMLKDEMDALERELSNAHEKADAKKKSLEDLSIEELVNELKKEVHSLNSNHRDDFRSKFDSIFNKKEADKDTPWSRKMDDTTDAILKLSDRVSNDPSCVDVRTDCAGLKEYCATHKEKLYDSCKKTCNYCDNCYDQSKLCPQLEKLNQCERQRDKMAKLCPKSCGYCNAPAPPKCSKSKYGCCWDKETPQLNKAGSNCPSCKDQYKYVCKTFEVDCPHLGRAGEFMRFYCPKTCNLCTTECKDSPDKAYNCGLWKTQLNWCKLDNHKETMRHFCPKTCEFC